MSSVVSSNSLRQKFLEFFEAKGHKVVPSSSLIPENDPSVLFTTAGMHPLVPYLLGEKHPLGKRLCNVQKCLRTDDIEEVGDIQHLTFFEMLGYWSLGDYFKKESIHFTFEFYTEVLGFKKDDISVTVFEGDNTADFDEESFLVWKNEIKIPEERIYKYPKKENWWGPVGEIGPCGPCTEMFVDTGIDACSDNCGPSCDCDKFVEIGNNVFMEFNKTEDGKFEKLEQKNVDVGLGFERLAMILQKKNSVFEIDIFEPIIKKIEKLSGLEYGDKSDEQYIAEGKQCWVDVRKQMRIVADHLRAATFAISDGALPSNKGAGYIVRRLIRRAVVKARNLKIDKSFAAELAKEIVKTYPIYNLDQEVVVVEIDKEEIKFRKTIADGLMELEIMSGMKAGNGSPGNIKWNSYEATADDLFKLFQTFGFPLEVALEEARKLNIPIIEEAFKTAEVMKKIKNRFDDEFKKHQDLSRTASSGMFKGGLADNKIETTRLHTAAHLLLAALRKVLGEQVEQKGSNITEERLRFDFNNPEKLTTEQIKQVENIVNEKISENLPIVMQEMDLEEAKKSGATGSFSNRYGDVVKIYTIGSMEEPFSREICGGPHISNISELGHFKITKEESSSSGVRRIKAILE